MATYQVGSSTYEVPDNISQAQLTTVLTELANREAATGKQAPVVDPLVAETNRAAIDKIAEGIPEPVKAVANKIGSIFKSGYNALPEDVQKAGRTSGNFLLDSIEILSRPFQATATYLKAVGQTPEFKSGAPILEILSDKNLADAQKASIRGIKGEYYPCKPDIFHLTYDEAYENNSVN
jgi:hypothetical protein